jgi:subtilisin family serine protease
MKKLGLLGLASLALAACSDRPSPVAPSVAPPDASAVASAGTPIAGRYLVVFVQGTDVDRESSRIAAKLGGKIRYTYHSALRGMAIELPDAAAAALSKEPSVASVEQDQVMSAVTTESGATWGIDRIDQHALPLDGSYTYNADGTGVTAYIIDTGILFTHTEFGGRAVAGVDEVTAGGNAQDCNGHGTHVSGTVGGATYGVAKNVSLVAVRVLDCNGSGTTSGVVAGVDWVTANHRSPAVANMSLGGSLSSTLDQAVSNSIASGVTYGIAAGNGNAFGIAQDACSTSPADVPSAITVGATDNTDTKASWSNYGTCVDIFGPGVNITSSWYTSTTATNTISGTSMATPHVVGSAALYLQANPAATPAEVASALTGNATAGVVKSAGSGSPNLLLFTGFITATPSTAPPVASFTSSCSGLTCSFDASGSTALSSATYSWDFGDASTGAGKTTSHAYAASGSYSVVLTVTDANGTSTSTQTVTVTAPAPTPAPVASFTYSCSSRNCHFDASATTNATSYSWNFGDGSTGSGVTTSHSFAPNRSYTVTLTATGSGGTSTASKPISCAKKTCS